MTPIFEHVDSIAIFGSVVRRDFDQQSDKDILLVSNSVNELFKARLMLENQNWSCSCYTWPKLERIKVHGGLFMQHLKQEAIVLKDRENRLSSLLDTFTPRSDYSSDIQAAMHLFSLLSKVPIDLKGTYWAMDVLMVALRNYGILTLANEGEYVFSFNNILKGLENRGVFSNTERLYLQSLRQYKRSYRDNISSKELPWENALQLIEIVDRRLHLGLHCIRQRNTELVDEALTVIAKGGQDWYRTCRLTEAALLGMRNIANQLSFSDQIVYQHLVNCVKSPSDYGWYFRFCSEQVLQNLTQISKYLL